MKKIVTGVLIIGIIICSPGYHTAMELMASKVDDFVLLIDPGHGGPDSGAVADDGTEEKNLNLEIAEAVAKEAEKKGMKVVMTRSEDTGLYADKSDIGWSKTEDIHQRKKIAEESKCDAVLMIHLNSYKADESVHGAQVFFPTTGDEHACAESEQLGKTVQDALKNGISDGSARLAMGKSNVFMMQNVNRPTILVECGFMSNESDLNNLKIGKFQQKIAVYIIKGFTTFYKLNFQKK